MNEIRDVMNAVLFEKKKSDKRIDPITTKIMQTIINKTVEELKLNVGKREDGNNIVKIFYSVPEGNRRITSERIERFVGVHDFGITYIEPINLDTEKLVLKNNVKVVRDGKDCVVSFPHSKKKIYFLSKPIRGSGISNMGNVAEGILACAFVDKIMKYDKSNIDNPNLDTRATQSGTVDYIKNVYKKYQQENLNNDAKKKGKKTIDTFYDPPLEANKSISDSIQLRISLGSTDFRDFGEKYIMAKDMIMTAVKYVNSKRVKDFIESIIKEGAIKNIIVEASGAKDQNVSKVDIKITIESHDGDKKEKSLRISLKTDSSQLGQVGSSSKDLLDMFVRMFGDYGNFNAMDASLSAKWDDIMSRRRNIKLQKKNGNISEEKMDELMKNLVPELVSVSRQIYKKVFDNLTSLVRKINAKQDDAAKEQLIKNIASGIGHAALGDDYASYHGGDKSGFEKIVVVTLKDKEAFEELDFYDLEEDIKKIDMNLYAISNLSKDNKSLPTIEIGLEKSPNSRDIPLVKIRTKMETSGLVVRNYIEKGSGVSDLANIQKKLDNMENKEPIKPKENISSGKDIEDAVKRGLFGKDIDATK